jgi:signal transduction histidine kinase
MSHSLQGKIVLRLTLTTLAAIAIAYGWLWYRFESTTAVLSNRSLVEWGHSVAKAIKVLPDGTPEIRLPSRIHQAFLDSNGKKRLAVRDRKGEIVFSVGGDVAPLPGGIEEGRDGTLYRYDPDGPGPVVDMGVVQKFEQGGVLLFIQVEETTTDRRLLAHTLTEEFFEDGGWLAGPFLLVLLAVSIFTVRRSLGSLKALSAQAETIGPATTDLRLPEADVPFEVLPFVRAVNQALERLEQGYRVQQDFTANAAHELRTPLAILTAHIDTLPDKKVAASLRADLEGISRLMSQLLRAAQVESLTVAQSELADLNEIAGEVAAFLARLAVTSGKSIELIPAPQQVLVHGNADSIFHALRNLAENALAHTAPGTDVTIEVLPEPAISVLDRGLGVPKEQQDKIFERFWRADRRRAGAGLGLAIVKRTMEMHQGHVSVAGREGGGSVFTLHFPPPPSGTCQPAT